MQCIRSSTSLHAWVSSEGRTPLKLGRGGEKLIENGPTMARSSRRTFTKASKMEQPRATLVESDIKPRKEKTVVDTERRDNGRFTGAKNEQDLQTEHVSRMGGHGTLDYLELLPEFFKEDGGPPRWFCPVQKSQQAPAPLLLSLPGIAGTGAEFVFHYEDLGRLFELRCLHIPSMDRTPFEEEFVYLLHARHEFILPASVDNGHVETQLAFVFVAGLVSLVEDIVREEAGRFPGRPIYLVGDDFGGALALAVAAQNPRLDLVLILLNPSTSFDQSTLQPFVPVLRALPPPLFTAAPFLLGILMSDPSRFTSSKFANELPPFQLAHQLFETLLGFVSVMPNIANCLSKETVLWKLQLLNSGAKYANSRLHSVKAEVLVLASKRDQLLPSLQEAKRLSKTLPNCTFRQFDGSNHSLLLEGDFDLATVIKSTGIYRQSGLKDPVANFTLPTEEEITKFYDSTRLVRRFVSPVFFSTGNDGKVVEGLSMVPTKGPIIFVGHHSLMGLDMKILASELLKARQLLLRGLAHPILFQKELLEDGSVEGDLGRLFGAVPVTGKNMFNLLARGDNVALYPGGAREALHRKGEAHMLFWPEKPEFVKMAARFGATIVPMCTVGEDEILEVLVDYDEMTSIPVLGDLIVDFYKDLPKLRSNLDGEVSKQLLHMPVIGPKLPGPGRMYLLFGQPIYTKGRREDFCDPKIVSATYHQIKREVEAGITYLLKQREEDPYRHFLPRVLYELPRGGEVQAPTFKL